jgi:hypothetical protein
MTMTLFAIAIYGIPAVLALVTILIGIEGMKFYWAEVVVGRNEDESP